MAEKENKEKYVSTSLLVKLLEKNLKEDKELLAKLHYL
jgi:hypothetical protein